MLTLRNNSGTIAPTSRILWNPQAVDQVLANEELGTNYWMLADEQNTVRNVVYKAASHHAELTGGSSKPLHSVVRLFGTFRAKFANRLVGGLLLLAGAAGALEILEQHAVVLQRRFQRRPQLLDVRPLGHAGRR